MTRWIYADGVFDPCHLAHCAPFQQIKKAHPDHRLLVAVCADSNAERFRRRPILTHPERQETIRHCRWLDRVLPDPAPWIPTVAFLRQHGCDLLAHNNQPCLCGWTADAYAAVKSAGMFLATARTPGISTSQLVACVLAWTSAPRKPLAAPAAP